MHAAIEANQDLESAVLQHVDSRILLSNLHAAHTVQPRQLFTTQQSTLSHRLLRFRPNFLCPCKKVECVLLNREVATEFALLTTALFHDVMLLSV